MSAQAFILAHLPLGRAASVAVFDQLDAVLQFLFSTFTLAVAGESFCSTCAVRFDPLACPPLLPLLLPLIPPR